MIGCSTTEYMGMAISRNVQPAENRDGSLAVRSAVIILLDYPDCYDGRQLMSLEQSLGKVERRRNTPWYLPGGMGAVGPVAPSAVAGFHPIGLRPEIYKSSLIGCLRSS